MLTRNGIMTLMCMGASPIRVPFTTNEDTKSVTIIMPNGSSVPFVEYLDYQNTGLGGDYVSSNNMVSYTVLDDQEFTSDTDRFGDSRCCILLGTGTTAPTVDDYKLESCITEGYTRGYMTKQMDVTNCTRTFTLTITASEDLTINELGLYFDLKNYYNVHYQYLVARKVLSTPITVEAGKTASIQYTLDFKNINAD